MKKTQFINRFLFSSIFEKVRIALPDPILGINIAYNNDMHTKKVNLGVGAYRDDNLKPVVFKVVRKVEEQIIADRSLNKEYIPIDGIPTFNKGCQNLIFGKDSGLISAGKVVTAQCLSGSGSLRMGFQFIKQQLASQVHLPDPTWTNHENIIKRAGLNFSYYPYYDPVSKKIKIAELIDYLSKLTQGNIILLHSCAHNPTGVDPTQQDWKAIAQVMKQKKLIPFFDSAYQGFASGDLIKDIWSVRYFAQQGFEMFLAQSFAKNMGLYGQRVGALHMITNSKQSSSKVLSQLKMVIRASYSTPPFGGARIADKILNNDQLFDQWKSELKEIANRVITVRSLLRNKLEQLKTPGDWSHITNQIGMFSYTGLSEKQVQILIRDYHIYMMKNGRIAMVGLTTKNLDYVAESISYVVKNIK